MLPLPPASRRRYRAAREQRCGAWLHRLEFFFQQLLVVELGVVAVPRDELVVRPQLDDAPAVQHRDAVRIADGGDAMRDKDGRTAQHHLAEMLEDLLLGVGIDARERVIEDENPWVADDGARDRSALLLSAGERDATLPHHGLVLFRELFNVGRNA